MEYSVTLKYLISSYGSFAVIARLRSFLYLNTKMFY